MPSAAWDIPACGAYLDMPEDYKYTGFFRRQVDLRAWDERTVVGWLEDDCHHFGVTLAHDGRTITDIRVKALRFPWQPCPGAEARLRELIGAPLVARCADIGQHASMRVHCTHTFELVGLLSAHAYHGRDHRRYSVAIHMILDDPARDSWLSAALSLDGRPVMAWETHNGVIMAPAALAGQSTGAGFRQWTEGLSEDAAEQAHVLRRAVFVAPIRGLKNRPPLIPEDAQNVCFAYDPSRRQGAGRDPDGSVMRDYDQRPEDMLAYRDTMP
jgi:hypothetical protein